MAGVVQIYSKRVQTILQEAYEMRRMSIIARLWAATYGFALAKREVLLEAKK